MYLCILIIYFKVYTMYYDLNTNIIIGILPSHSYYNVFAMHILLYICFSLSMQLPSQYALSLTFFYMFPLIYFNSYAIYKSITYPFFYSSCLYLIPHSKPSLIAWSITEPKLNIMYQSSLK